jgi:hypothetical protein
MVYKDYLIACDLLKQTELERVALLFYYYYMKHGKKDFTLGDVVEWFSKENFHKPNLSRLKNNIKGSLKFINAGKDTYSLHARTIAEYKTAYPQLAEDDETVIVHDHLILPESLTKGTRGYIRSLALQINHCFENNIFDGCAVLMRRLLEILLIQSYQKLGIDSAIQLVGGGYKSLEDIINDARQNKTLALTKGSKECLNDIRLLGNYSAHRMLYVCRKDDIKKHAFEYRACIEELLHKSGILS